MIYDELDPVDMVRSYFLSVQNFHYFFFIKFIDISTICFMFGLTKKSNTLKPSSLKAIHMCP